VKDYDPYQDDGLDFLRVLILIALGVMFYFILRAGL
jgi:hypothetical protein